MDKPRVRVYLDDNPKPFIDQALPTDVTLDTRSLADGPHRLLIRAQGQSGREGIEEKLSNETGNVQPDQRE